MNKKPTTYAVALVIYDKDRSKYLITRRPLDDDSLPGYWGFPATSKKDPDEGWGTTVGRAAKSKLGVDVEIIKMLGEDTIDRGNYVLVLRDYEVKVVKGKPIVPQNIEGVTQYIAQKWTDNPTELKKSAADGSLCSRVFLRANNIEW